VRFTWCSYIGIKNNEIVDIMAKRAEGEVWNNLLTRKKIITFFKSEYDDIDGQFLLLNNKMVDAYT